MLSYNGGNSLKKSTAVVLRLEVYQKYLSFRTIIIQVTRHPTNGVIYARQKRDRHDSVSKKATSHINGAGS